MFSKVSADLGKRIKDATEALVKQNEQGGMATKMASLKVSSTNGAQNGINSHNSGMFAHKDWSLKV